MASISLTPPASFKTDSAGLTLALSPQHKISSLVDPVVTAPSTAASTPTTLGNDAPKPVEGKGTWTKEEHERFLTAMEMYPNGPWKKIAEVVKSRTIRQTQTHAQKYREKLERRRRGLRTKHVVQNDMALRPTPYIPPYQAQVDAYYPSYHSPYQHVSHYSSQHHQVPAHPAHRPQYEHSYMPPPASTPSYQDQSHYLPPPPVSSLPPTTSYLQSTTHYNSHYDSAPMSQSLNLLWDPIKGEQSRSMLWDPVKSDAGRGQPVSAQRGAYFAE
ncbi:hypothetical protein SDRG_16554 [Saprolegnia diclina VS20]|uniref:Uncharacterized protein n=1 Tax=Saprolegnia diclina (strain VS20) TaxID=1156394 RepID=T0PJM9_SAPDV|nr:hypothetical protein SDRG_16554 [Saprolegnia diclina VS20]EQC25584.1 hypothetical protein SDRG_16554 [Saprolegnia diclina VS20]|eukprot:XP_008620991.1 hypothetical protein SDRG_16554 [Saprolegnia diclina VS20]